MGKIKKHKFETEGDITNIKMFLFARWISTCYADELLDSKMRYTTNEDFDRTTAMSALNRESGEWWKEQLKYFNMVVYPNYIKNGSAQNCKEFLEKYKNDKGRTKTNTL